MRKIFLVLFLGCLCLPAISQASDGFIKGGFIMHPSDVDLSNRWLVAFGSDYVAADQFSIGFELQTAYYSDDSFEPTIRIVPLNLFANVKYKGPFGGVRPYVGGGLGLISTFFNAGDSDYVHDFGYHIMGGLELGREDGAALILEIQGQQKFSGDINPFNIIFFGGVRF
jgi:hypothetical protein